MLVSAAVFLAGCAIEPEAIDRQAMSVDLIADRAVAQKDVEPITGSLSL